MEKNEQKPKKKCIQHTACNLVLRLATKQNNKTKRPCNDSLLLPHLLVYHIAF